MDFEHLQQDCIIQAATAIEAEMSVVAIKTAHLIAIKFLRTKHKHAICDTQARHVLRLEKQKLSMVG
jgi:hypothetical protein